MTGARPTFYAYVLQCADGKRYYGHTDDLARRLKEHRGGLVRATRPRRPVNLVWFHAYPDRHQARQREKSFKHGKTLKGKIEAMIASFSKAALAAFEE